jgi:hypothetical protein
MKNIFKTLPFILLAGFAQAQSSGTLQVNGQAGKYQIFAKVKAIRCEAPGKCDAPVIFDLNKAQSLPSGKYLVGFENSLNPNMVQINEGQASVLQLQTISIPAQIRGQNIRIFRDLSSAVEQSKILQSFFQMKQHFFRVEGRRFGDLYLTGSWDRDVLRHFDYSICPKIKEYASKNKDAPALVYNVCSAWVNGSQSQDLRPLFSFNSDGSFEQHWVSYPGDVFTSKIPRLLVSVPVTEADTVAVFPGVYKIQSEDKGVQAVSVSVGI